MPAAVLTIFLSLVRLARDLGIQHVHFEADSLNVIKAINSTDVDRSHIGGIIEATKAKLALFTNSICSHIRRKGSSIAHELARLATLIGAPRTWLGDTHPPLRTLAAAEAPFLGGVLRLLGCWTGCNLGGSISRDWRCLEGWMLWKVDGECFSEEYGDDLLAGFGGRSGGMFSGGFI
ncbi:hypothetical protein U1Q18_015708 [Sarracenia purpurea var. burkii]